MIRGTTAQFRFNSPYQLNEIASIKVTVWQPGNSGTTDRPLPIVKGRSQCQKGATPYEILTTLSQEETLRFSEHCKAYIQFRAVALDGTAFASKAEEVAVYPVYDDSIIGDVVIPTPDEDDEIIILDGSSIA